MKLTILLILLTVGLLSCSIQSSDKNLEPTGVKVEAGLDDVNIRGGSAPWIKVRWDEPTPSAGHPSVQAIGVEITDADGESIMLEPWDWSYSHDLWKVLFITPSLEHRLVFAGCAVSPTHITITANCADIMRGSGFNPNYRGFKHDASERWHILRCQGGIHGSSCGGR